MRKLLPYEHQLIESLDISKEQYLEFVAIQQEYKDPKVGTALDVRNEAGTVALVLTIVGILFQVGAALLTPKPEIPGARDRRRQRQQRFAPTFGFNSTQELATYGDPVNLVYTNTEQNPNGGVRVSGSLVWSAIENFGSSQFMQLLMVLGASKIRRIDPEKTAFGQLALNSLNPGLIWIFYKNNSGLAGNVQFGDLVFGNIDLFPKALKKPGSSNVCLTQGNKHEGYSQAYSPSSSVSLGVYDPIPINVDVLTRNKKGKQRDAPINIKLTSNEWISGSGEFYDEGEVISIKFESSSNKDGDDEARDVAKDIRRQTAEALTYGATYMLGAAKFKLIKFTENPSQDVDDGDVTAQFKCIESGRRPTAQYSTKRPITHDENARANLENAERVLSNDEDVDGELVTEALSIQFGRLNYNFTGTQTVSWTNEVGNRENYSFSRAGSIENTKQLREDFLAEKPTLDVKDLTEAIERQIDIANNEIDNINAGEYDEVEPLNSAIDAALRADRQSGKIAVFNTRIQNLKDKRDVSLDKQTPKNRLRNTSFVNNDGGTNKQRVVLNQNTDVNLNKAQDFETKLDETREKREKRRNKLIARERKVYVRNLRNSEGAYRSPLTNNYYFRGGIRTMERRLKELPPSGKVTDQNGAKAIKVAFRQLIDQKRTALKGVRETLEVFDDEYIKSLDNNFFVKCLVKCESASYETINACNCVRFSIKSKLYRRISGRQKKYADKKAPDGYRNGDNGVKGRMAFFRVRYKKDTESSYRVLPIIFVVRHGTESDFYNQLNFESNDRNRYSFQFDPVYDPKAETSTNGQNSFGFIENSERVASYSSSGVTFSWSGRSISSTNAWGFPNLEERGPRYTNEWDMFSVNTDTQVQFSHESGPEFLITAVTEQQKESTEGKYNNQSMMSVNVTAGRGIQDLRNITAFVTKGKDCFTVDNFDEPSKGSTSFAPDIFVDTVVDPENGVAKYAPVNSLDQVSLKLAKNFCIHNNLPVEEGRKIHLFMDGVIADAGSWRSFWIENAPFSLLELARKNGADTLIPAIPVTDDGRAADNSGKPVPLNISALFTPGNILEDSFKEEFLNYGTGTQDLIATVIYRETNAEDVFSVNKSVEIRKRNVDEAQAIRQTFDASQFVTQKEQAIMFGKLLVNQRHWIRKGIEFRTFPSQAAIEPGAFIYVDIGLKDWDSYSTGIVMDGGELNSPIKDQIRDGSYSFLFYDTEKGDVDSGTYSVSGNVVSNLPAGYVGRMFVMGVEKPSKRVYRVTEVAIEEEGEVSVKALEFPCFTEGDDQPRARVADFRADGFDIQ
jgi:hypothetical protein